MIECVVRGIAAGLGEPVFDKLEADLAKAMLSIPATKGFEIGSGFAATRMRGSQHNDPFEMRGGKIRTTNKQLRRRAGRDQQWRRDLFSRGIQADPRRSRFEQKTVTTSTEANEARGARDAMIRACFPEQCQSWKRWPRSCFAIMRCGTKRYRRLISDVESLMSFLSEAKNL